MRWGKWVFPLWGQSRRKAGAAGATPVEKRRAERVLAAMPVFVYGHSQGGAFAENTETLNVSANGGLLLLSTEVRREQVLLLTNLQTDDDCVCRVARMAKSDTGHKLVGVEFLRSHPRFWYAGNLQRAAEQGMHAFGRGARDQIAQYWKIWEAGRARQDPRYLGEDPMVGSTRHLIVADTDAEAVALARRAFRAYAEHFHATETRLDGGHPAFGGLPRPGGVNFDEMLQAGVVMAGSAATLRDKLRRFLDAVGPQHNYLVGAFQWGDLSHEEAGHSLDLFAAEVKPALEYGPSQTVLPSDQLV